MANGRVLDNGWLDEEDPTTPWRARARVAVRVEVTLASESQFFAGLSGDVSEGGIFVQTYRPLAVGDRVALVVALPAGDVEILGVVQWVRDADVNMSPGFGAAFERLSPGSLMRIEEFCRRRPPLYHDIEVN